LIEQVEAAAQGGAAAAEVRASLEEHQRQVARWEGRVARQLEKIVALQRGGGSRGPSLTPSPAPTLGAAKTAAAVGPASGRFLYSSLRL
jgi:hypothetical protein